MLIHSSSGVISSKPLGDVGPSAEKEDPISHEEMAHRVETARYYNQFAPHQKKLSITNREKVFLYKEKKKLFKEASNSFTTLQQLKGRINQIKRIEDKSIKRMYDLDRIQKAVKNTQEMRAKIKYHKEIVK